jgi:cell division protein FtsQ
VTDPRIHARRVGVERERGRRRLRLMGVLVAATALSAGAIAVLHSSLFSARQVVISGDVHTTRAQVFAATGLNHRPPLVDIDAGALARRLEALPWVASASVHVAWPTTVDVELSERVPVATSVLAHGGYALLDAEGRVLADYSARPVSLPVVAGTGPIGAPGTSVAPSAEPVLAAAAALPVSLLRRVTVISETATEGVVVQLTNGVKAVVGNGQALAQKFVSLATVLESTSVASISSIDLRVPAAPVLTPQVGGPNVSSNGGG